MKSIWSETAEIPGREALSGNLSAEVAVIGAGMAGILTAYLLQKQGKQVVVLEAERIGSGQTKNTTAKITSQHSLIYDRLIREFGMDKAQQYASANEAAIAMYRSIIALEGIDCHFESRPAFLYSTEESAPLMREAEAAASLGIAATFTTDTTLPFPISGAVRFEGQAQFHPLDFLCGISKELTIFENTKVKQVDGNRLITDKGIVTADHVVFATHYPFPALQGLYIARMYQERSYVVTLEDAQELDGMYIGIDEDGLSMRNMGSLLLLGGGKHRTGENSGGGRYATLRHRAKQLWNGSREVASWSAQDCITLDGIPYIGKLCVTTPDWYVATGFGKWGMTSSMVAAMLLSDRICGRENPNEKVFCPQRLNLQASGKELIENTAQSIKGLSRHFFASARADVADLPCGHGGVVEYEEGKAGVYKDENGEIFVVSVRCPHLGCELEWNPDEKSWDCPCHGSRFDYHGRLIDNPAQEDLPHE